jgi:hypothetical protein
MISPSIIPITGSKHHYLNSGILTNSSGSLRNFQNKEMNDNIETEEIDEIDINPQNKEENFNFSPNPKKVSEYPARVFDHQE